MTSFDNSQQFSTSLSEYQKALKSIFVLELYQMIVSTWEVVFHPIVVKNVLSIKMERIRNWSKQVLRAYPLSISGEGHHLVRASKTKQVRKIGSSFLFCFNHYTKTRWESSICQDFVGLYLWRLKLTLFDSIVIFWVVIKG